MANITKVYLLDVPLEADYKNTLYFASASDQQTYFQSKVVKSYTDFSYQRKDNIIRIPEEYDNIYNVNYVMYQNSAYSNKWFYAFVKSLKYVNDGMTEVEIETDVIQTWLFDYTIKSSFVEREHTSDDTIGANTVPELLETGPFIQCTTPTKLNNYDTGSWICIAVSEMIPECAILNTDRTRTYNSIYSGLYYCICTAGDLATNLISIYDIKGKADAVYSVFLIPKKMLSSLDTFSAYVGTAEGISFGFYLMPSTTGATNLLDSSYVSISRNSTLAGNYTPRNNKLLTGEFNYMMVTNNAGTDVVMHYEDFNAGSPRFKMIGAIGTGCSIKCVPVNYKILNSSNNIDYSYNYGIAGAKLPVCSWNSDAYTNWLTENSANKAIKFVGASMALGAGALFLSGGVALGSVAYGASTIGNLLASEYEHSLTPDQARGNTSIADVNYSSGNCVFTAYQMSIKPEYSAIIDGYFDMFGYKVNKVKVPNTNHRSKWWYTKTVDVSLTGNIPNEDILKIKECYNNGIRFWRNANEIENYSLSNGISNIV